MSLLINPYRFAVAGGGGGGDYSAEVLADSPLAYYRLSDNPGGSVSVAAASSNFSAEPPSNAFDGSAGTYWTTNGTSTGWLRAQLASAKALTRYRITRRGDIPTRNPKDWTFEGSNDGTTWATLDTQTGVTWPTAGEVKTFDFVNSTSFLYYRLNVTANNGDTYLSVAELGLSGTATDVSGFGRDGSIRGANTATGLVSGDDAMSFSGGGGITVPSGSWLNASPLTVEAWFKLTGTSGTQAIVSHYDGTFSSGRWEIRADGTTLRFYTFTGSYASLDIGTVAAGTPYHVAVTVTGGTVTPYLNAVAGTPAARSMNASGSAALTIAQAGTVERLSGVVDEVAIYGSALSGARIAAHYAAA